MIFTHLLVYPCNCVAYFEMSWSMDNADGQCTVCGRWIHFNDIYKSKTQDTINITL